MSCRRAAELFEERTVAVNGEKVTLHQLRHSALTPAAEDGASTPMLMAFSGHASVRSLAKYARPSAETLARWWADRDAGRCCPSASAGYGRSGLSVTRSCPRHRSVTADSASPPEAVYLVPPTHL
ncbi:tyrosine-type recombinase/integrase [Streptomyces sp. NBC_01578]|uniref:tyrosine-type recombinase/integrase n=1 Tax=Streptomyces sp. NBC_01578 TaxID=2975884 RepID=UPI003863EF02